MNRRSGLVALFVGAALVVGIWLVLPVTEQASSPQKTQKKAKKSKLEPQRMKAITLDQVNQLDVRSIAARQEQMQALLADKQPPSAPGSRPPGVFPLDQQGIATAIDLRKRDLQACYETALFHTPGLSGTLTLSLQVVPAEGQPYATIQSVDTESELDATVFEGCVATVFEELKFDATEPTTVRYPVTFTPGDDEE